VATVDLLRVDLNLLKVFESVYRLRNLTQVANEIRLTQPAVSHALRRLRSVLGDPLFVRTPHGLEPTPRSDALAVPIKQVLSTLEDCLDNPATFQPEASTREFRLLLSDVGELIFVPRFLKHVRQHAPQVKVTVLQAPRTRYDTMLRDREADVAVGSLPTLDKSLKHCRLFEDRWVVLRAASRKRRATPFRTLTEQEFEDSLHVVVDPPGSVDHPVEREVSSRGLSRTVALNLPHFFALPTVILTSDLLATVPYSVAASLRNAEAIEILELPFPSPVLDVRMYWHARQDSDLAHMWLRETFMALFSPGATPATP
jgi:DNA-binding transcriptional LysR family regulator